MEKLVVRTFFASFALLLSFAPHARSCPDYVEMDAAIKQADADGEVEMRRLLSEVATARGLTQEQTSNYLKSVLLREGPVTTQNLRMSFVYMLASAIKSGNCRQISSTKNSTRAVIATQWKTVNEEISNDLSKLRSGP